MNKILLLDFIAVIAENQLIIFYIDDANNNERKIKLLRIQRLDTEEFFGQGSKIIAATQGILITYNTLEIAVEFKIEPNLF